MPDSVLICLQVRMVDNDFESFSAYFESTSLNVRRFTKRWHRFPALHP